MKEKFPKTIRVRIIPLAVLKKRLATAQIATAKFESDHKGRVWSKSDKAQRGRLLATERKANTVLSSRKVKP